MDFGKDDLKHLSNLIGLLHKRVAFKDLSGPEVLTTAFVFQWLGELKEKIQESVDSKQEVYKEEPVKSVTKEVKKKK